MSNSPIRQRHLSYSANLESRSRTDITLVVIHCTELPDLETARDYGERVLHPDSGTGNSGHYYIDRNGRVEEWVPAEQMAHHVRGHNQNSIGIELVNRGRYPDWLDSTAQEMTEPYPAAQIQALISLLCDLSNNLDQLEWIAGHEQLDQEQVPATDNPDVPVCRKRDPGPLFPWSQVLNAVPLKPLRTDTSAD